MSARQPESLGAAAVRQPIPPVEVDWSRLTLIGTVLAAIGVIGFALGLITGQAAHVWPVYLVNFIFFYGLAQGTAVCVGAFFLTQARWGGPAQYRLAEAFSGFLPLAFVLFLVLIPGRNYIFPWIAHPLADAAKAAWLNVSFLFTRDAIGIGLLGLFSLWLVSASRSAEALAWQRSPRDIEMPPPSIRRLAPIVGILYAAVITLLSIDLVMSLSPQWHSTLFGWWFFATVFWSGIVAMSFTAMMIRPLLGPQNIFQNATVRHDLGKMIFAFSIFWMYLTFAQYIVIWYADIPSETFFLVVRLFHHPWTVFGWLAPILIWLVPFVILMGVKPKKNPSIQRAIALLGLIGIWDLYYVLIMPALFPNECGFGWIELSIFAGFLGAFLLSIRSGLQLLAETAAGGMHGGE